MEVAFDYKKMKRNVTIEKLLSRPFSHARYVEFYPVKNIISIQEGGTPLIRSKNIEKMLNLDFELYFKFEGLNPTGSFKDRGSSVEVAKAVEFGAKKVVCASTGNMGASVSAYSGVANLKCLIFTPEDAKPIKLKQILGYGAKLFMVKGDYSEAAKLVEEACAKYGLYLLGDYLYRREGTKSVGFEIFDQLNFDSKNLYIVSPVGNGTLISSVWKASKEFFELGFIRKKPKLIGIQAEGCNPVVKAFKRDRKIKPVENPRTIATAIECGNPLDGDRALKAIVESKGFAESVSDGKILEARELLAKKEGIFTEPAGAVSLAGLMKVKDNLPSKCKVVCLATGHGLKTPKTDIHGECHRISDVEEISNFV